jgi:hypothetical protein
MSAFFQLPRELRDLIYEHYFRCDGGYVYNTETRKLRRADGDPISRALAFTCRQAASELKGLEFQMNAITFSATYMPAFQENAALNHAVFATVFVNKKRLLRAIVPKLFTRDMGKLATEAYPRFSPLIEAWLARKDLPRNESVWFNQGEAVSLYNDFMNFVLRLISQHPNFCDTVKAETKSDRKPGRFQDPETLVDLHIEPWRILDKTELNRICELPSMKSEYRISYYPEMKLAYSAAALALQFLNSCTKGVRNLICKIVLIEDEASVGRSECHGRGFIPLCQENRRLHVERRANLWRTVFSVSFSRIHEYLYDLHFRGGEPDALRDDRLDGQELTASVGRWIAEAMALPSLGMPEGSYTLIFDGNPTPEHTSTVFRVVQQDAAWQAAFEASYSRGLIPGPCCNGPWLNRRGNHCFIFEGLPEAVQILSSSNSLIRCNFDIGEPYDVEEILEKLRGCSWYDWNWKWSWPKRPVFQTEPPLPPWHELKWLHVVP